MKYYLKRLGHQELGSVKNGKAQRGRYIYISKDKNVVVPLTSANNDTDKIELIKKYKKLLDEEIITKEEFEQQKKKLLDL